MAALPRPCRGEVWHVALDPVRGHEQGRSRPPLVISADAINRGPANLITIVPITSRERKLRSYLRVEPPEGGLTVTSFIICDQVRTISLERFGTRYGRIDDATMGQVELRIRLLLDLR